MDAAFAENSDRELVDSRRSLLRQCLDLLAAPSRELLDLRYGSGLSLRDAAERLKRTEAAVQVALSRVRKWLTDCVQKRVDAEAGA